eukprot:2222935-Prymnesium_polylepis.1
MAWRRQWPSARSAPLRCQWLSHLSKPPPLTKLLACILLASNTIDALLTNPTAQACKDVGEASGRKIAYGESLLLPRCPPNSASTNI